MQSIAGGVRTQMSGRTPRALTVLTGALVATVLLASVHGARAASPPAPAAATGSATSITYSAAVLHGSVNPRGQTTNYFFQYGRTRKYGAQTPLAPAGSGTSGTSVSQSITGLEALSTYHYRIVAIGPVGTTLGADRSFVTPKIPLSVAIVGAPNPVVFGNPFVIEGTLSGTGSANHLITLQANPFPYLGGFQPVGNPQLTSASGGFSFPFVGLPQNTQLRVVTLGKPAVSSPVIVEGVAVRISLHAHATRRHGFARLYGTVAPAEVGALVGFQLLKPGHRSSNVGGTTVKAGTATVSRFSRTIRVHRGLYQVLVKVFDGAHVSGYSAPVLIR
jgi:hypothetical protein